MFVVVGRKLDHTCHNPRNFEPTANGSAAIVLSRRDVIGIPKIEMMV
jgi:hypothetical protein